MKETFYVPHGSPALPTAGAMVARNFFRSWRETVCRERPSAILVISAHWDTAIPTVNVVDRNDTMYDFGEGDHDPVMYTLKYPAPGAPELAKRVKELLLASGFQSVGEDRERGLDHGAWIPLLLMYPDADIPVCQLSIQSEMDGTYHYNLGKALAPLKAEGVLIIGSGNATNNGNTPKFDDGITIADWALAFDTWLKDALLQGRFDEVNQFQEKAPCATIAHPHPDHLYPLNVAMGAAGENAKATQIHHSWSRGVLSYALYQFSAAI